MMRMAQLTCLLRSLTTNSAIARSPPLHQRPRLCATPQHLSSPPLPLPLPLYQLPPPQRPPPFPAPPLLPPHSSHNLPASSPPATFFVPISPANLPDVLSDPHTLIQDIRPLPAYLTSRVPHAVPLSVPSTLLKHTLLSTLKLAEMPPNKAARHRFSQWRLAQRILVYDADSTVLPDGKLAITSFVFSVSSVPRPVYPRILRPCHSTAPSVCRA
ncbi:hypothetical protein BC826DRAFT_254466 [Russula brevipes]|nr:hypothetical protein BC826DRAFT_254466 [Russula brevipes]